MPIQICPACHCETRYLIPCPHCGREHCPDCSPTQAAAMFSAMVDCHAERAAEVECAPQAA